MGDEIVQLENKANPTFEDLKSGVTLSDLESGVSMEIRRPGESELRKLLLKPQKKTGLAMIGMSPALSLRLGKDYPPRSASSPQCRPLRRRSPARRRGRRRAPREATRSSWRPI